MNNSGDLNLDTMMEVEIIKHHFIAYNKEWLIRNMHSFIDQDHFEENSRYLLHLFQALKLQDYNELTNQKRNRIQQ